MAESTLLIRQDTNPQDPRKDFDPFGTMVTWHRRYQLGDQQPASSPKEYRDVHVPKGSIELPLFMFDHSGISISTDDAQFRACDSAQWDWGKLGFIYVTPEKIRETFMCKRLTKAILEKARQNLQWEVEQYNDFLQGNVWGYIFKKAKPACASCGHIEYEEDSCWGFFGSDLKSTGLEESVPEEAKPLLEAAWEHRFESKGDDYE